MALNRSTAIILVILSALLGGLLAACGVSLVNRPTAGGLTPTVAPNATAAPATTVPVTTVPATAVPATATPVPAVTTAPTTPPYGVVPEIGLAPALGGPGTTVTVTGRRFGAKIDCPFSATPQRHSHNRPKQTLGSA